MQDQARRGRLDAAQPAEIAHAEQRRASLREDQRLDIVHRAVADGDAGQGDLGGLGRTHGGDDLAVVGQAGLVDAEPLGVGFGQHDDRGAGIDQETDRLVIDRGIGPEMAVLGLGDGGDVRIVGGGHVAGHAVGWGA